MWPLNTVAFLRVQVKSTRRCDTEISPETRHASRPDTSGASRGPCENPKDQDEVRPPSPPSFQTRSTSMTRRRVRGKRRGGADKSTCTGVEPAAAFRVESRRLSTGPPRLLYLYHWFTPVRFDVRILQPKTDNAPRQFFSTPFPVRANRRTLKPPRSSSRRSRPRYNRAIRLAGRVCNVKPSRRPSMAFRRGGVAKYLTRGRHERVVNKCCRRFLRVRGNAQQPRVVLRRCAFRLLQTNIVSVDFSPDSSPALRAVRTLEILWHDFTLHRRSTTVAPYEHYGYDRAIRSVYWYMSSSSISVQWKCATLYNIMVYDVYIIITVVYKRTSQWQNNITETHESLW